MILSPIDNEKLRGSQRVNFSEVSLILKSYFIGEKKKNRIVYQNQNLSIPPFAHPLGTLNTNPRIDEQILRPRLATSILVRQMILFVSSEYLCLLHRIY